jgi:hypothetical protein
MGGDAFVLLLQGINNPSEAAEVSGKIIDILPPFRVRQLWVVDSICIRMFSNRHVDK